jgi:hypothetical protein
MMDFSALYQAVFRTQTTAPGYALLPVDPGMSLPQALAMLQSGIEGVHGSPLNIVHQVEFDQQVTTRFHRDGGPEVSFLFLGYAPTPVESVLAIADHVRAGEAQGLSPIAFLEKYPPLSADFEKVLAPFTTTLAAFNHTVPQVLLINNSLATGVLHRATIPNPDPSHTRQIVSWMLTS